MKHSFKKIVTSILLTVVMLTLAVPFTASVSAAAGPVVIGAGELYDVMETRNIPASKKLVNDDGAQKKLVRFDVTSSATGIKTDLYNLSMALESFKINVKAYPYIQVGYRFSSQGNSQVDFNASVSKYTTSTYSGANRLWGPKPNFIQNTFAQMDIDYTSYSGGEKNGGVTHDWDYVDDKAIYTSLLFKPFNSTAYTEGDFFEFEYIAFFPDKDSRTSYVHETTLEKFTVAETMSLALGEMKLLPATVTPSSAYVKVSYEVEDETVAMITDTGIVIGLKAGTTKITAKTSDEAFTDTCTVTVGARATDYSGYIIDRDNLENLKYKAANDKKLNIVYLGGSVTNGSGATESTCWRGIISNWFKTMFPDVNVTNVNSAMGGSGSMLGAFRLEADVLAYDPDLVFVEFAVNDSYSGHLTDQTIPMYYEYILRAIREKSPDTEIICLYVIDKGQLDSEQHYDLTPTATIHDAIANKYGVTGLKVGRAMANEILETRSAWDDYVSDSVHPSAKGYRVYANVIEQYLFDKLFVNSAVPASIINHTVPTDYYDSRTEKFVPNYVEVSGLDVFKDIKGWTWNPAKVYANIDTAGYISPTSSDNSFTFEFTGTAIGLFFEYGKSGHENYVLEMSIDGNPINPVTVGDTNHAFNKIVKGGTDNELEYGKHTLTFSYKGNGPDGGVNTSLMLTRILVQTVPPSEIPGDVDNDFAVTPSDGAYLARYVAGWSKCSDIIAGNADLNTDGEVTIIDSIILSRHLASWNGYDILPLN